MTDYSELVKDLRNIEKTMFALGTSPINMDNVSIRLAYDKRWGQTANDAAAAIEALEIQRDDAIATVDVLDKTNDRMMKEIEALLKENKELIEDHPEMVEADGHWEWRKPNGEVLMPKRGEWIIHGEPPMLVIECSVCGQKYFNHVMQEKAKYCSMCGAKMEVQDGE